MPLRKTLFLLCLLPGILAALPENPNVIAGETAVAQGSTSCHITQTTNKTIINWDSFSIAPGESVQFIQPSSSAVALNRIIGQSPSQIFGSLSANGQVFLINPNGILFAPGAVVNTAGLVATTLELQNSDFLAGSYNFYGAGGSIINKGDLQALDHIVLIAGQVNNEGRIMVNRGPVHLCAGSKVAVALDECGLITAHIDAETFDALTTNQGYIKASTVTLSASSSSALFETVVNNQGIIEAASMERVANGNIRLKGGAKGVVEASGKMQASGGLIHATGERVYMSSQALMDVGAENDGGRILLIGDKQISLHGIARAGSATGKGGFIETSASHVNLEGFRAQAPGLKSGLWLIDPVDLTINHSSTNSGGSFDGGSTTDTWSGATSPATLGDSVINTALASATDVVIDATTGTGGTGTITVQGGIGSVVDITIPANKTLTFTSGAGGFTLGGYCTFTLNSGSTLAVTAGTGGVTMTTANDQVVGASSGVGTFTINTTGPVSVANSTVGSSSLPLSAFTVSGCTTFTNTDQIQANTVSLTASSNISSILGTTTTNLNIDDTGSAGTTVAITTNMAAGASITEIDRMILPNAPTSVTITNIGATGGNLVIATPTGDWNLDTNVTIAPQAGSLSDIHIFGYLQGDVVSLSTGFGYTILPNSSNYVKVNTSLTTDSARVGPISTEVLLPLNIEMPSTGTLTINHTGTWTPHLTQVQLNLINNFAISQLTYIAPSTEQNFYLSAPTLTLDTTLPADIANQYVTLATSSGNLVFADGSQVSGINVVLNPEGSVVNNSTAYPIISTTGTVNITAARGTIGTLSNPVTVATPSTVTVFAGGFDPSNYVSIAINGSVVDNTLHFNGYTAGFIYFNGVLLLPYIPTALSAPYVAALAYVKTLWWPPLREELIEANIESQVKTLGLMRSLYGVSYRSLLKKLENTVPLNVS